MNTKFKVGDKLVFLDSEDQDTVFGTVLNVDDEGWHHLKFPDHEDHYSPDEMIHFCRPDEVVTDFEDQVRTTLEALGNMLIEKNKAYGDSALNPVRIFSKADPVEQIMVRIDDKLSRLSRGAEYAGDDTVTDLLGYLVLLKIARDGQSDAVSDA